MAGWAIPGRDLNLSDDSTFARRADDECRFGLISLANVRNALQQRPTNGAKAALGITDLDAGTPGDGTRGERVRHHAMPRHRRAASLAGTDHEIGLLQRLQRRRHARRIVLPVGIDRDHRLDARCQCECRLKARQQRGPLAAVDRVAYDAVSPSRSSDL